METLSQSCSHRHATRSITSRLKQIQVDFKPNTSFLSKLNTGSEALEGQDRSRRGSVSVQNRQRAFDRVIATNRYFSQGERTRPLRLGPLSSKVSSFPEIDQRYTLLVGSGKPVCPWSVK